MGWLWPFSSTPSSQESGNLSNCNEKTSVTSATGHPPKQPESTRNEQIDPDLAALIKAFSTPDSSPKDSKSTTPTSNPPEHQEPINPDRIRADGSLDISPPAVLPRTMSCRQAFDQAFYCQSLGGKFNDIYRYGQLQSCSEQWNAFWFCMRTRTLPTPERERRTRDHYARRIEAKMKEFGSSEDVWEIRHTAVPRAFWKDPDLEDDGEGIRTTD